MIEKLKAAAIGFVVALFSPYPAKIAAAVAVLAVTGNLMGLLCALRRGEKVSGKKILRGNLRIAVYFLTFGALSIAIRESYPSVLTAVFGAIAGHEFMLVLEKGMCAGIIPAGLVRKLEKLYEKAFHSDSPGLQQKG